MPVTAATVVIWYRPLRSSGLSSTTQLPDEFSLLALLHGAASPLHQPGTLCEDDLLLPFSALIDQRLCRPSCKSPIAYRAHTQAHEPAIGDPLSSGAEGIRTLDPLNAIEMRSQLRYSPIFLDQHGSTALDRPTSSPMELKGFEPLTSSVRLMRAPSCATAPFKKEYTRKQANCQVR